MTEVDSSPRVLVTNAEQRAVLAACRGLHDGGFAVGAVSESRPAAALWSRACRERLGQTPPATDARALVDRLASVVSGRGYRLVVPGTDAALFAVSRHRELLDGVAETALPGHAQVTKAFDRVALFDAASRSGFDCPSFRLCTDGQEALTAGGALGFPVMVKPLHAVVESPTGLVRRHSIRVDGPEKLAQVSVDHPGAFIVQAHEAGRVASFSGVHAGGRLVASAFSRYRWGDADLRHALWQLRHRRVRAALRVARPRGGTVHAYARWSDPGPLAARLAELGMVAGRRRAGRRTDPG